MQAVWRNFRTVHMSRRLYWMMVKKFFGALGKCFQICFGESLVVILIYIGNGLISPLLVNLVADIIDNIQIYIRSTSGILFFVGALSMAYLYQQMNGAIVRFFISKIQMHMKLDMGRKLLLKRSNLTMTTLEKGENNDLVETVTKGAEGQLVGVLLSFSIILSLLIEFAGLFQIIGEFNLLVGMVIVVLAVPLVVLSFKGGRKVYLEDKGIINLTRFMNYYSTVLSDREHVNERTLFGYNNFINQKFEKAHLRRSNANTLVLAKWMTRIKLSCMILLLFVSGMIVFMVKGVSVGILSVGVFISLSGALIAFVKRLAQTLSKLIFDVAGQCEFLSDLDKFMSMPQERTYHEYTHQPQVFERLDIENLSFRYPGTSRYVLQHLNLSLEKGKSYSLVGINGAGKSTLIKLLTGAYKDFEGNIRVNGRDIRLYSDNQLRNMFSVVYQDYSKYQISIKDNITFGNEELWEYSVLKKAGLQDIVDNFNEKEHTLLGKIEGDGVDLSGGEWQKLVIARALVRKTPFMIMDEPTASLSARMENDFYTDVLKIKGEGTLLLISHRMAATKLTDKIIVLDGGRIREYGSHEALLQRRGQYFEMYEKQRRNYCEEG